MLIAIVAVGLLCQMKQPQIQTKMIHDSHGHVVETIKQYGSGSQKLENIYDSSGHLFGYVNRSGTYDAEGHLISPDQAPELIHPK
ncbi:MAG: hypothetical protein ACREQ4_05405 [Candidatus Binataceae bacterium]